VKLLRVVALSSFVVGSVAFTSLTPGSVSAEVRRVKSVDMGKVLNGAKRYIVRFADSVRTDEINSLISKVETTGGAKERLKLDEVFAGSVIDLKPAGLQTLLKSGKVLWAEPDTQVKAGATQDASRVWGLDRIDQRNLPLNSSYTYDSDGSGVTAYIVDTGILGTHTEFGSRVRAGYDALGGDTVDCNGHGTHVSGTVGGTTYGVAKNVNLVAVPAHR
jgi:subtilisin family serine protease